MLKIGRMHEEARDEAAGLRAWAGRGTVALHSNQAEGGVSALLLERVRPGTELGRALPEAEQDVIIANLLQGLWIDAADLEPLSRQRFRPLRVMCEQWDREHVDDVRPGLDPGLVRAGLELWRTLPATADRQVLLLTDLHAGNVLAAEREPWLVIDPKPYLGDPTYDCVQHMVNCPERLYADPRGFADRMADLCGVDRDRLHQWLFARCIVELAVGQEFAPVATTMAARLP